ncbi:MAG: nucleotidyltransferase family protein [Wenzhouxiangellaceae bacterium]
MTDAALVDVIILAGDRGADDPIAASQGVPGKVLARIEGRTLLDHVLEAVSALPGLGEIVLVAPDGEPWRRVLERHFHDHPHRLLPPAQGPAASVAEALESRAEPSHPVLVVTGDHPLLQTGWLEVFIERAGQSGAAVCVGVTDAEVVAQRFAGSRRTRYRFSDSAVCGCNLFWFNGADAVEVARLWRGFEQDRKRPWRILARLGPGLLLRYLAGRVTLAQAMEALSARFGLRVAAIGIDAPEAAVDVDSLDDFRLVKRVLGQRRGAGVQ